VPVCREIIFMHAWCVMQIMDSHWFTFGFLKCNMWERNLAIQKNPTKQFGPE